MFLEKGAFVVDADKAAREVVEPGTEGLKRLFCLFGQKILLEDGSLNRKALADIIFNDEDARKKVNEALHPLILDVLQAKTQEIISKNKDAIIFWDAPLLFEASHNKYVNKVIVVYVPVELQLERLMKRNKLSLEEAKKRIKCQMDIEEKKKLADFVIDNSGCLEDTRKQVEKLWDLILQMKRQS